MGLSLTVDIRQYLSLLKMSDPQHGNERGLNGGRSDSGRDYTGVVCNVAAYSSLEHVKIGIYPYR